MNKNSTISKLKKKFREDFIYNIKLVAGIVVGAACLYGMFVYLILVLVLFKER